MNTYSEKYPLANMSPRVLPSDAWVGHVPFAFALIEAMKPDTLVELGTYSGTSFFAFCQAVEKLGLPTRCYGIDMWEGDVHMGSFTSKLYEDVTSYKEANYPQATFIRKFFEEAVDDFEDGSIDVLHIDGTHTYEAVSADFRTWLPKMSDRGVILFHDTNATYETIGIAAKHFGVDRFFAEVKKDYPGFEFFHSFGLGVLAVGKRPDDAVLGIIEDAGDKGFLGYFEDIGARLKRRYDIEQGLAKFLWRKFKDFVKRILAILRLR